MNLSDSKTLILDSPSGPQNLTPPCLTLTFFYVILGVNSLCCVFSGLSGLGASS